MTAAENLQTEPVQTTSGMSQRALGALFDPETARAELDRLAVESAAHAEEARADLERLSTMLTAEPSAQAENLAANRRLAAAEQTIADVAESLQRLEAGTYGLCARCDEHIPAGRLEMRPHSRYCVTCT